MNKKNEKKKYIKNMQKGKERSSLKKGRVENKDPQLIRYK